MFTIPLYSKKLRIICHFKRIRSCAHSTRIQGTGGSEPMHENPASLPVPVLGVPPVTSCSSGAWPLCSLMVPFPPLSAGSPWHSLASRASPLLLGSCSLLSSVTCPLGDEMLTPKYSFHSSRCNRLKHPGPGTIPLPTPDVQGKRNERGSRPSHPLPYSESRQPLGLPDGCVFVREE